MRHRLLGVSAEKCGEVAERGRLARNRMMAPAFALRDRDVFSASPPWLRVIAASERFGAGIAWPTGACLFPAPGLSPFRPFRNQARTGGGCQAPGFLRFKPVDSPFARREGAQPVPPRGPVPPRAAQGRSAASRNDHTPPHAMALAPDALPRDGTGRMIRGPGAVL